jgi:hypothetical protein
MQELRKRKGHRMGIERKCCPVENSENSSFIRFAWLYALCFCPESARCVRPIYVTVTVTLYIHPNLARIGPLTEAFDYLMRSVTINKDSNQGLLLNVNNSKDCHPTCQQP